MFFSFINLGCTKNLVDTQFLLGRILEKWPEDFYYGVDPYSEEVELVFLNTCGFISSGRNEMFQTIKKLLRKGKKVCLLGCAVQYFEKLAINQGLNDAETQMRATIRENSEVTFLSWKELAHFEPALLGKEGGASEESGGRFENQGFSEPNFLRYHPDLKEKARELRGNMTKAEKKMRYDFLSPFPHKFTRQKPIDYYIVDFYSHSLRLVIEIDGDTHWSAEEISYDKRRTEKLAEYGIDVLRFTNQEVFENFEEVCQSISDYVEAKNIENPLNPPYEGGQSGLGEDSRDQNPLNPPYEGGQLNAGFGVDEFERPQNSRAYTNIDLGFEYLKIAEGCNNSCSFCIIPQIRGKQVSLPIETLVQEAKNLISQGVKELILIAQDSTRYGVDLYGKSQLFELLEAIDAIEGDFRYRVLYLYPDILTKKHLQRLTQLSKFIPYFDLPLQHASPKILKAMGRFYNHQMTLELLQFIKENFEDYYIRTNFIIGFPGEMEEDFRLLMDFIGEDWFNNIALFEYHDEPLATSSTLPEKVDDKTTRNRFLEAKKLVAELFDARETAHQKKEKIGTITDIRTNKKGDRQFAVRPLLHCPEIDSEDEIGLEQILESFDGGELKVGGRVVFYK